MSFWSWLWGPNPEAEPPKPSAAVTTITQPIAINLNTGDRAVGHAQYRLDAMLRYIAQQERVSAEKIGEFRKEARIHLANLVHGGHMTEAEADDVMHAIKPRE